MKLDLLNSKWLELVFEGRNKSYGAYDLRKKNTNTNIRAFIIGAFIFSLAVATPLIISLIPDSSDDQTINQKVTTVKLPPKEEKPKEDLKPPPPPPPKQDVVKFVKPVVAKTDDVVEEIKKIDEIKDQNLVKKISKVMKMPIYNLDQLVMDQNNRMLLKKIIKFIILQDLK